MRLDDLGVVHDALGPVATDAHDAGVGRAVGGVMEPVPLGAGVLMSGLLRVGREGSCVGGVSAVVANQLLCRLEVVGRLDGQCRQRPASRAWRARRGCRPGPARPWPVTPRSTMVCMHRSQRTGLLTCADETRQGVGAVGDRCAVGVGEQRDARVADVEVGRQPLERVHGGGHVEVWNAPATWSGMTRALAGGSAANAASCSRVPAATTWPAPLTLAAVRPCRSSASATSAGSPPRTALMPVGVSGAGGGHRPRRARRTKPMASWSDSTPGERRRR